MNTEREKITPKIAQRLKKKEKKITDQQINFMKIVHQFYEDNGWLPSQREIGRQLNVSSSATSNWYVAKLESMGLVEWNRTAGIRLTNLGLITLLGKEEYTKRQKLLAINEIEKILDVNQESLKKIEKAKNSILEI